MTYLLSSNSERDPYRPMRKLHVRPGGPALGTFGSRTYAALQASVNGPRVAVNVLTP